MKASFIVVKRKQDMVSILVREDKLVMVNFGSNDWFNFRDIKEVEKLCDDKGKNKKYKDWINSKKFNKDYNETIKVMEEDDFETIVKRFILDFKKSRDAIIIRQDVEIDPNKRIEDLQ